MRNCFERLVLTHQASKGALPCRVGQCKSDDELASHLADCTCVYAGTVAVHNLRMWEIQYKDNENSKSAQDHQLLFAAYVAAEQ